MASKIAEILFVFIIGVGGSFLMQWLMFVD